MSERDGVFGGAGDVGRGHGVQVRRGGGGGATWCGNCRRIAPELEALAVEFGQRVRFVKVNADESPGLVARFGVGSTPTLFVLTDGTTVTSAVGAQPAPVLRGLFETAAQLRAPAGQEETASVSACACGPSCGTPAATTVTASSASWAPAEACTLPVADQPARMAQFDSLFATSLVSQHRESARWLRLRLSGEAESSARELTAREAECCSFYDFQVRREGGQIVVDVRVPEDKITVLDGIAAQAEAARI